MALKYLGKMSTLYKECSAHIEPQECVSGSELLGLDDYGQHGIWVMSCMATPVAARRWFCWGDALIFFPLF